MRYFMMSRGRPSKQYTLQSLTPEVLSQIELMVVEDELKAYKAEWYSGKVKSITPWPKEVDFSAKKRKWFGENAGDDYVVFDDDVTVFVWSTSRGTYVKSRDVPNLFNRRLLEEVPELFKRYNGVSMANKFMANPHVKSRLEKFGADGLEDSGRIGYTISGFSKKTPRHLKFNGVFCYTDMYLPLQALEKFQNSVVYYGVSYGHHNSQFLESTGITYRTHQLLVDSVLKLAQRFPGVVLGYRMTGQDEDRMTLIKRDRRLVTGVTDAHKKATESWIKQERTHQGLRRLPEWFDYDDEMPMEEIISTIKRNWKAAKSGK